MHSGNYAKSGYIVLDGVTRRIKYFNSIAAFKEAFPGVPNPSRNSFAFMKHANKLFVFRLTDKMTGQQIQDLMAKLQERLYAPFAAWTYDEVPDNPKGRKRKVDEAELSSGKSQSWKCQINSNLCN